MCAPSPFALGSTNWRNARLTREKWRDAALTRTQSLFEGVTALTSITIGTVTSIGIQSFYGCSSLTSFPLASVTKIERVRVISRRPRVDAHTTRKHRLSRCTPRVHACASERWREIWLPCTQAGFQGCTSLESVIMDSVTQIGSSAFQDCIALTSVSMNKLPFIQSVRAISHCPRIAA